MMNTELFAKVFSMNNLWPILGIFTVQTCRSISVEDSAEKRVWRKTIQDKLHLSKILKCCSNTMPDREPKRSTRLQKECSSSTRDSRWDSSCWSSSTWPRQPQALLGMLVSAGCQAPVLRWNKCVPWLLDTSATSYCHEVCSSCEAKLVTLWLLSSAVLSWEGYHG